MEYYTPSAFESTEELSRKLIARRKTLFDMKNAGFSALELRQAGYKLAELKAVGIVNTCTEARAAGFTLNEALEDGYTVSECSAAGYATGRPTTNSVILMTARNDRCGSLGTIIQDDKDGTPYQVRFEDGTTNQWYKESQVKYIGQLNVPLRYRPTTNAVVLINPGNEHSGKFGVIIKDDHDECPFYVLFKDSSDGHSRFYRESQVTYIGNFNEQQKELWRHGPPPEPRPEQPRTQPSSSSSSGTAEIGLGTAALMLLLLPFGL